MVQPGLEQAISEPIRVRVDQGAHLEEGLLGVVHQESLITLGSTDTPPPAEPSEEAKLQSHRG